MEQDLSCVPMGVETLLVGDLKNRMEQPQYHCEDDLETAITNYRLVDRIIHFITRQRYRVNWGWPRKMWRYGRPIMGRGDYIIGT